MVESRTSIAVGGLELGFEAFDRGNADFAAIDGDQAVSLQTAQIA